LVTGASGGIGSAIARRLATDGFQLALPGRRADALAEGAASLASETGAQPVPAPAGPTRGDQVASPSGAGGEGPGGLAAVGNTAGGWGGSRIGPFMDKTEAELRAELENNLMTTVLVCHAVLPLMVAQRYGRIVNISSIAGLMGLRGHSV